MSNTSLLGSFGGQAGESLMFRNRIINGDMRIDQRNAGANVGLGGNTEAFITDRFRVSRAGGTATLSTIRQVTTISGATNFEANSAPAGFTHALKVQIGTAQAVGTTFETEVKHNLEGFNGADWGWGTADAKPVTLSFWVKSSLTGNFGVGMRSATFNYSIVTSYTINAANTWEYKTITITPPTSGTFSQDAGLHHTLYWDLGVGSTFSTSSLNTWQAADFRGGLTGGVKLAETAGANFYITGVQIEAGPTATPFERRPYSVELGMCQRYYYRIDSAEANGTYLRFATGSIRNATLGEVLVNLPQKMRVTPALETSAVGNFFAYSADISTVCTGLTIGNDGSSPICLQLAVGVASGLTAGRAFMLIAANNKNAWFAGTAEL